ncbi:phosphomannomutase/phosphoglucomutase [Luteibacter aegosomatissinici]|uniref:phosphomannomutase/phosphoglucomutase n=1 Tax=Luteibacter aegosomatissinici TaxID=2911539 RepID=UPI001FF79A27|nr:phosphomannomutase/phosphoglucomutase [Luteibacter aegosomatissinici]UPG94274.1 phosphomannomutase/phosphoglucomutase [Luteibacter aegosomatissinici]
MARIAGGEGRGPRVDVRQLLTLVGATVLIVAGAFCAWQAWLIADEENAAAKVREAQAQAVRDLSSEYASLRQQFQAAVNDPALLAAIDDHAAAAARLRALLPTAQVVEVYSPGLDEVVRANYREFGYAKAAQLMAALGSTEPPPASTRGGEGKRRLSVVEPMQVGGVTRAWAWLEYPFDGLASRFEAVPPRGGRLELRQGDGPYSLSLMAEGSKSGDVGAEGQRIAGTALYVFAAMPRAFIVIPHSEVLAALLALIGLGGGAFLLWSRSRPAPVAAPEPEEKEVMVADVQRKPRLPPSPAPGDMGAAPEAPARAAPARAPVATPAAVDPAIFRAYDIRGVAGDTLTVDAARQIGQAIGAVMLERDLRETVVGRDGRLSGPELAGALIDGLRDAGIDVIDLGVVPSPLVYFACFQFGTGCGVAVTGSHNPPDHNGFKIVVGGETLAEDAIADLYRRIAGGGLPTGGHGSWREQSVVDAYVNRVADDVSTQRRMKIVVDAGNGAAGLVAPRVLEEIGCEVVPLYCDVDGRFPNHHPDPSDPHNLGDLIAAVHTIGADLGIAFDGDGDRLGVVTPGGEIIFPDRLLMLYAQDVLARNPGATVIYDVKCTGHLRKVIQDAAGVPLMWRTGHSLIKAKMRDTGAALAGEMSGHFFFADNNRWYGFDDGVYAAARLMEILAADLEDRTPAEIFDGLPKSVSTPEIRLPMAEGVPARFMEAFRAKASFDEARISTLDGVRADWPDGWGLVRASNTSPALVFRFDADNAKVLERVKQAFRLQLHAVDAKLPVPF